jgi:hypothetical protein
MIIYIFYFIVSFECARDRHASIAASSSARVPTVF